MTHRCLLPIALLASLLARGAARAGETSDIFAYDRSAPFNVRENGAEVTASAVIHDLTLTAGPNVSVKAYLVTPTSTGPHPAVLYVHWLGEPATTNRTEFLPEATELAGRGVVALLVDAMWAEPKWYRNRIPEEDYERSVRQVIELRRAMDLLLAQPGIDPQRVAFVGHDFGAMYGMIANALDRRARTYVFMTGIPHLSDWFLFARQPANLAAYRHQIAPLDPVNFIGRLAPASIFFQFASHDEFVSAAQASESYAAAAPRKQMTTYDATHALHTAADIADRQAWLVRELELKP